MISTVIKNIKFLSAKSIIAPIVLLALLLILRALDPFDISQRGLAWVTSTNQTKVSSDIVIVDIDAASQSKYGRWPFDRRDLATLITRLKSEGAGAIILDLPLQDPDRAKGDDDLARALATKGVILVQNTNTESINTPYAPKRFKGQDSEHLEKFHDYDNISAPLAKLTQNVSGVGTVDFYTSEGLYNKFPLVLSVAQTLYPSPIIEALRYTVHESHYDFKHTGKGLKVSIGQFLNIPVDLSGKFYINYSHEFETVKLDKKALKAVKNKIVIVGSTIPGVNAQLSTANGPLHSHVIQAHALQTLLDGPPPLRSTFVIVLEFLMAMTMFLALWYFWQRSQDIINCIKLALIVSITAGVPFVALSNINVLFDPVWPTIISLAPVLYILYRKYQHNMRCYLCQWICSKDKS